ncbi:MAG: hypothetical protein HC840_07970 [Leptolyngbyaceae cyanobacterium RM2_2_4]|nr:hypothetical protein [Leptolyngbyaceae cyanobacterium RM2_2_4]
MEGSIHLTTQVIPEFQRVHIQIRDQRPNHLWSEPLSLSHSSNAGIPSQSAPSTAHSQNLPIKPSFGLSLLVNQSLIEKMHGRLEVSTLPVPVSDLEAAMPPLTQIQCSIPWMVPE